MQELLDAHDTASKALVAGGAMSLQVLPLNMSASGCEVSKPSPS
jgi:hypothetical protein